MHFSKLCLVVGVLLLSACGARPASTSAVSDFGGGELPLVAKRTAIAATALDRQLALLPFEIRARAACIGVLSRDVVGWGLLGAELGAGLVSCRRPDGAWSAPSYVTLEGFDLGPNVGFMNEDATFVLMPPVRGRAFAPTFAIDAGVYATAGSASVELSVDTTGCVTVDLSHERRRNCVIAVAEDFGLQAGAYISFVNIRHMSGLFGASHVGRNKHVYGPGVAVGDILTMPGSLAPSITWPWLKTLAYYAP